MKTINLYEAGFIAVLVCGLLSLLGALALGWTVDAASILASNVLAISGIIIYLAIRLFYWIRK